MGLDWKIRAATLDNVEENDIENCMEIIRKTTETKSFDEIVKLLHVVSSEQKARKMLRTCMDKVLMNMAGSSNLRDVIDRLRSVARINGLRFNVVLDQETSGPGTTCQILADMFTMEITLDGESQFCGPSVLDVKILYTDHVKKCPKIVEVIRDGNFLELSKQLKGLTEIYPSSMDRTTRTRMYMALQSLDMDLLKMSQVYRESHKDCEVLEIVLSGYVGLLTPRDAGTSSQLKYFLSPYDLMDIKTKQMKSTQNIPEKIGMIAEIGIEVNDGQCRLPITPLIANNHPTDETSKPRFSEINQHNSVLLPACYTLKLHPPVPVISTILQQIQQETKLPLVNEEKTSFYLPLIRNANETTKVMFDSVMHRYHLDFEHTKASLVQKIHFTNPEQVVTVINLLRKQCYLNSILSSCMRKVKTNLDSVEMEWCFDVSYDDAQSKLNITFEHPTCPCSTAFAEIQLSSCGITACHLYVGRGEQPLCSNELATKVLQKSLSLPITMRSVMIKTKKNRLKEPEPHRVTRHPVIHFPPQPPKPHVTPQPTTMPASVSTASQPITPEPQLSAFTELQRENSHGVKKEFDHPMLTKLLKPNADYPAAARINPTTVQPKNHPMLVTLLNDDQPLTTKQPAVHYQATPEMPPQYPITQANIPDNYFTHPPPPRQMPPPPSYPNSMKSINQQHPHYQMPYQSQPSPLNLDDLTSPIPTAMPSPSFSCQSSVTPPLVGIHSLASPITPSAPSPMYSMASPMNPPMNTPQPLPSSSPLHPVMTPPLMSPAPRKSLSRRSSRQKSNSLEATSSIDMQDLTDIGFNPQFEMMNSDNDGNNSMTFNPVNPGVSPAHNANYIQRGLVSPVRTTMAYHNPLTHQQSNNRSMNFSFEPDVVYDGDMTRSNALLSRNSNPPSFLSPQLSANSYAENQNDMKVSEMFDETDLPAPPSYNSSQPITGQNTDDIDPFTFDDNGTPSKISIPDQQRNKQHELQQRLSTSSNTSLSSQISQDNSNKTAPSNVSTMHKPLVRQNALFKGSNNPIVKPMSQSKAVEGKERKKKGAKEEGKTAARRRGRPPSIDKKEHAVKRKKLDTFASSEDNESRPKIVLNVQLNKGVPISSVTKTKPVPPETQPPPDKTQATAEPNTPSLQDLHGFPADFQRYLNNQAEMDRKKKEKKFVTGSVSPVTTQANKAAKTASGQSAAVVNTPGGRGLFAPIKSASITNKSTPTRPAPGTPTSPKQTNPVTQTKGGAAPAARHRKSSIKDVVEMLHAGQAHVTKTTTSNTLQRNTSVQAPGAVMKSYDRQTSSVDAASKSKPSFPPQSKPPSSLSPKLGGKSPAGGSSGKASVSSKPTFNKTTNVVGKHGGLVNRANIIRKDPKIKSSAREGQNIPVSKSPPKTPTIDPKMKHTLIKIQESAAAQTFKTVMNDPKQSRPAILRATSGSKSPGRTPTPPQRSGLFRTETLQALLKGKSPSHTANISSTDTPSHPNSNVSTTTDDDIASKVSSKSTSPYPRRASFKDTNINLNRVEPVQTAPTTNSPSTPDDKLIIDDHTQADKFEQEQPVAKHNTSSSERVAPLAPPVIDTIPSDFTMSPTITDQCLPDDDLMNAAVS